MSELQPLHPDGDPVVAAILASDRLDEADKQRLLWLYRQAAGKDASDAHPAQRLLLEQEIKFQRIRAKRIREIADAANALADAVSAAVRHQSLDGLAEKLLVYRSARPGPVLRKPQF